jgi:hypothetical protein
MMRLFYFLLLLILPFAGFAVATDTVITSPGEGLRISILTCGAGEELYASFGHTGVRVRDDRSGRDEVYNYGTFNFSDPDFYSSFVLGKLQYYLERSSFRDFMYTYQVEKRSVKEQELNLDSMQQQQLLQYLETNLLPENRYYAYDFLFDNCATRVRDIFPAVLGPEFYFGTILGNKPLSYRAIINQYLAAKHWERLGINLLLGSKVDSVMTDDGSMFLPAFVHKGLEHAQFRKTHLVSQERVLLASERVEQSRLNGPMWLMLGILILTVLAYLVRSFSYLKVAVRFVLLFVTGLLGCLMLFMWLGTAHQSCSNNYNILWAIPLNLPLAFLVGKKGGWLRTYALAGISLIIVSLIIHLIGIQTMPLIELSPLLICLMYVYMDLYKNNPPAVVPVSSTEEATS